jgi:hypothetical protein
MRRLFYSLFLAPAVALTFAAIAWSAVPKPQSPSQIKLEHNRQAAHADALHLLKSIRLPAGTRRTTAVKEHRGFAIAVVYTSYVASVNYLVPSGVNAYEYVMHHRPDRAKLSPGYGDRVLKNGKHVLISRFIMMNFPSRNGVLFAREANANFRKLKDGRTDVSLIAQSSWIRPRPSAEKVPAAVTQVVLSGTTRRLHSRSAWAGSPITTPATVGRLIKLVDRPGIIQDGVTNCPEEPGPYPLRSVTLSFENASGMALASVSADWSGPADVGSTGWSCNPLSFNLGSKSEPELADLSFLPQLHKLLGVKLDR